MVLYDVLCLPHSGNVMTEPKVPPRYEKETNVPFSDSGDHLNWDFSVKRAEWKWFESVKKFISDLFVSGLRIGKQGPSTRPCTNLGQNDGSDKGIGRCRGSCCCCVYDDALPESINNWEADVRLKLSTDDRYEGWENCAEEPESYCDTVRGPFGNNSIEGLLNNHALERNIETCSLHCKSKNLLCAKYISKSATRNLGPIYIDKKVMILIEFLITALTTSVIGSMHSEMKARAVKCQWEPAL